MPLYTRVQLVYLDENELDRAAFPGGQVNDLLDAHGSVIEDVAYTSDDAKRDAARYAAAEHAAQTS